VPHITTLTVVPLLHLLGFFRMMPGVFLRGAASISLIFSSFFLLQMKIESFLASSLQRTKKFVVNYDCQYVEITRTSSLSISGALRTGLPELITVTLIGPDKQPVEIYRPLPLGAAAVFQQLGGMPIYEKQLPDGMFVTTIPVKISDLGIAVPTGTKIEVVMQDCIVGATYELEILEVPFTGGSIVQALVLPSTDNQKRTQLAFNGSNTLVIPALEEVIEKLRLHYANGKTFELTVADCLRMNSMVNDFETVSDRLEKVTNNNTVGTLPASAVVRTSRTSEFIVLPMGNIIKVDIDTDGTAIEVYQFSMAEAPQAQFVEVQ
jgi:hypothetical protein